MGTSRILIIFHCVLLSSVQSQFGLDGVVQPLRSAPMGMADPSNSKPTTAPQLDIQRSLVGLNAEPPSPPHPESQQSASDKKTKGFGKDKDEEPKSPKVRIMRFKLSEPTGEVDCAESIFMSPYRDPVTFNATSSVGDRMDPTCSWEFYGTEPCIPLLSCQTFDLNPPTDSGECVDEYLEVSDGYHGVQKYCGQTGPQNMSAAEDIRDLFIKFRSSKSQGNSTKLICTVVCSTRGDGTPLPTTFEEKVNPNCRCGTKTNDDRIVGGVAAEKNEFPWLVALVEKNTRQPFCGGSILNDRMILTAAHCFKARFMDIRNVEIIVNGHFFDSTPNTMVMTTKPVARTYDPDTLAMLDSSNGSYRFQVQESIVHPLYLSEVNDFDVAIVLLTTPIDFVKGTNKTARPICLPELGSYLRTFGGRKATVAGWGLQGIESPGTPEILQKVDVMTFSVKACKAVYTHRVNRRMLCAGYMAGQQDSCAGDSGGPIIVEDRPKVWYQVGSVSWGDGCANKDSPGVYFRTTESGQWLHYHSNKNNAVWCDVPQ